MYCFLQRKMCSECDVFSHSSAPRSFAQGVACDRHQVILVIVLPSPLKTLAPCSSFGFTDQFIQVFKLLWIACFASFHIPSMLPVRPQRATISSLFLQTEDTLTVVTRIVKYFGFSRQFWVAWCAI